METNLYAIKDELAGLWSFPFCLNGRTAQRTFSFMAKEKNESECKDQRIYMLGKYDQDSGTITLCNPEMVYDLEKAWKAQHKDD